MLSANREIIFYLISYFRFGIKTSPDSSWHPFGLLTSNEYLKKMDIKKMKCFCMKAQKIKANSRK
jgi:hypothetical protein